MSLIRKEIGSCWCLYVANLSMLLHFFKKGGSWVLVRNYFAQNAFYHTQNDLNVTVESNTK